MDIKENCFGKRDGFQFAQCILNTRKIVACVMQEVGQMFGNGKWVV